MADDAPRIATLPIAFHARETVGYSFQVWQPPLIGWVPVTELQRFSDFGEAAAAQRAYLNQHGGTLAAVLDVPGWKRPVFGPRGR